MLGTETLQSSLLLSLLALGAGCTSEGLLLGGGVTVRPSPVDLGRVRVGAFGVAELTVENTSDETVELVVRRTAGDDTILVLDPDLTVPAGGTATLELAFEPTRVGPARATITFSASDESFAKVEASGEGIPALCAPAILPDTLSFGRVVVGSRASQTIGIENCDVEPLAIHIARESNVRDCAQSGGAPPFCVDDLEQTITVPPDSSAAIEVSFVPTLAGLRERGELVLAYCDAPDCEAPITLEGFGVERGLVCSPAMVDFGDVSPGSCATEQVNCENTATDPVTIVAWRMADVEGRPSDPAFTPPPAANIRLPPGSDVDLDVAFCPTRPGQARGLLTVETDHPDPALRRHDTPLVGRGGGPQLEVEPEPCVEFGLAAIGSPVRRQVALSSVGDAAVDILGIDADADLTGAFTSMDTGPSHLEPGEVRVVTVEMSPTSEGPIESTMRIQSTDPDRPEIEVCLRGEGVRLAPCAFELLPPTLDFGDAPLMRTHTRGIELRNTGTDACLLDEARFEASADPTLTAREATGQLIGAGASIVVEVEYTPLAAGDHAGTLVLSLSNPTTPFVEVPVTGSAREGAAIIAASEMRFGAVDEGCVTPTRSIRVFSASALVVDEVTVEADLDFSVAVPTTPTTLPPGGSLSFDVAYQPRANGQHAGAIRIRGSDANGPLVRYVQLFGERAPGAIQIDETVDVGLGPVDVLFMLDTSGSMDEERDGLAQNAPAFFTYANEHAIDYQLGLATVEADDEGRLVHPVGTEPFAGPLSNRIITRSATPSPQEHLVRAMGIEEPTATEEALYASFLGLSGTTLAGHNAPFLRPNASLAVIYTADEPEQSPYTLALYADFLESLKPGDRGRVSVSAMPVLSPGQCSGPIPSTTHTQIADRTGGIVQPACGTDWDVVLSALGGRAFGLGTSYPLSAVPDASTIELYVNGALVPPGPSFGMRTYDYVAGENRIQVTSAAPIVPGATVSIRYAVACQ